jgi:hypothetical protein
MAGFADKVMARYTGAPEPDGDEGAPADPAAPVDDGDGDGQMAIDAVNKNDGVAFEAAVKRICGK